MVRGKKKCVLIEQEKWRGKGKQTPSNYLRVQQHLRRGAVRDGQHRAVRGASALACVSVCVCGGGGEGDAPGKPERRRTMATTAR